jgi:deoxycytidine triphosphate deaminase
MSSQRDFWRSEQAVRRHWIELFSQKRASAGLPVSGLLSRGRSLRAFSADWIAANANNALLDAKAFDERMLVPVRDGAPITKLYAFVPFLYLQYFCFPRNVFSICVGFSTCARCEIASERDAIRAGARGIRNTENLQHEVAVGQALNQRGAVPDSVFPFCNESCEVGYAGRKATRGKQQGCCAAETSALFGAMERTA